MPGPRGPQAGAAVTPEPNTRREEIAAFLSLAVLIGSTILKTVMEVGPLCDGARDTVRQRLVRIIEAALAKDQQS